MARSSKPPTRSTSNFVSTSCMTRCWPPRWGRSSSPWALLMLPVAVLISFAFAAVGMALATFIRSPSQFDYISLAVVPLFLFSTTFYPLSVYPEDVQWLVQLSPLYHGIELLRQLGGG